MSTKDIVTVIDSLQNRIQKYPQLGNKKDKFYNLLETIKNEYKKQEVPDNLLEVYNSLVKKGKELNNKFSATANSKEIKDQVEYYIRYLKAALGDLKNEVGWVNVYQRWFLFTSILFLVLSPQWFGFILPALFFVPIFLGLKGLKVRSVNGFYMSLSIAPIGFMTGTVWAKNGMYVMGNLTTAVAQTMVQTGRGESFAKALTIIPPILGVVLVISSIFMAYRGYKARHLFV